MSFLLYIFAVKFLTVNIYTMEKEMKVVRFIPAIVVEHVSSGHQYLETSSILYEDLASAKEALVRLIQIYCRDSCYKVVRSSVKRKFIEL